MSVIVGVRKNDRTVMAADTLTCFGDSHCVPHPNASTEKIRRFGGAVVGSAGWAVYDCILTDYLREAPPPVLDDTGAIFGFFLDLWKALHERYPFVNDQAQARDTPFGDLDSSFLIASHRGIFNVSHDMDVSRFEQYYAIGSGSEYALGALHALYDTDRSADEIARLAVETGIQFDVHCGGTPTLMSV